MAFAKKMTGEWGGKVPNDVDLLMEVPGIGRKIANLIVGEVYKTPAVVVDTHCKRVMKRIGITESTDPAKVEKDIMKAFPEDQWIAIGHLSVDLGRKYCTEESTALHSHRSVVIVLVLLSAKGGYKTWQQSICLIP